MKQWVTKTAHLHGGKNSGNRMHCVKSAMMRTAQLDEGRHIMIRVSTLRKLAETRRYVYRVRWRFLREAEGGGWVCDKDGNPSDSSTWEAYDQEFFLTVEQACAASVADKYVREKVRPRGIVSQVRASELMHALIEYSQVEPDCVLEFDRGRRRIVMLPPGYRLPSDDRHDATQ